MLLNKHNLNIHKFCATEESRHVLRAILVTKDETVATDGHRLIRVTTPKMSDSLFPEVPDFKAEDVNGGLLLHADVAKEIASSIPKGKQSIPVLGMARIGQQEGAACSVTTDLDIQHLVEGKKVEGEFPRWQAVIPTKKPAFEVTLHSELLAELAQFISKFSDTPGVRIQFFGSDQAVRFDAEDSINGQGLTAVLMPMRSSSTFDYGWKGTPKKAEPAQGELPKKTK